jgi:type IV pilus assembly protein PilP
MTPRLKTICNYVAIASFVLLFGLPLTVQAADPPADKPDQQVTVETQDKTMIAIKKRTETFEYQIEGRPDPFMPFVSERSTTPNESPDELIDENKKLTGMQLFEPGQLTLVALMTTGDKKFAMVQDFTGKGYILKEGTKVGRRGVVKEITNKKLIISETAQTRGGKILTNNIAMVLKKEGEE